MKNLILLSFAFSVLFYACNPNADEGLRIDDNSIIQGLATPFQLERDTSLFLITDYIVDPEKYVDSISLPEGFTYNLSEDKTQLTIFAESNEIPLLNVLKIWHKKTAYSFLLKKSLKQEVVLRYENVKYIEKVQVKGEMNGWNSGSSNFTKLADEWQYSLVLSPGKYAYLLLVDGKEMLDPVANEKVSNGMGGFNSVLSVGNTSPKVPHLSTFSHEGKKVFLHYKGDTDSIIVFWENYQLCSKYYSVSNGVIEINPPHQVNNYKRTYYRVWAYNSEGVSNDLLIPVDNGTILRNAKAVQRTEKYGNVIYNIMVDRFVDGNKENNKPLNIPEVLPKADYFGGDLDGITSKIVDNYFYKLGMNSLWISPIVQNPWDAWGENKDPATKFSGYHGYWPISSSKIDERFGTPEAFNILINSAHVERINVFLDYVANHVHKDHPLYKEHPEWATQLELPDGTLNLENWDSHRLTTWFDTFLPTIDFSNPEVVDIMTDSAIFWLKNYDIDGFRHDATKHIQTEFWRTLTYKMKKEIAIPQNRSLYQIGETYGSPELIGSYVSSGQLDAQFDFNIYDAIVSALVIEGVGFENLAFRINQSIKAYGAHNLMGNITGNQDRPRFISYADGSVSFSENTKHAGWTRKIEVQDTIAYQKLSQLTAIVASLPGIPVVFYGDEFGMPGANDPDCRRMMRFGKDLTKHEQQTFSRATEIFDLRKHQIALIYGDTEVLLANENYLVILRRYFDQITLLVVNGSEKDADIEFELPKEFTGYPLVQNFDAKIDVQSTKVKVSVKANFFDILTKN